MVSFIPFDEVTLPDLPATTAQGVLRYIQRDSDEYQTLANALCTGNLSSYDLENIVGLANLIRGKFLYYEKGLFWELVVAITNLYYHSNMAISQIIDDFFEYARSTKLDEFLVLKQYWQGKASEA